MDKNEYISRITQEDLNTIDIAERAFDNISNNWQLENTHISQILPSTLQDKERLVVISAILGIYKSLHTIFTNKEQADSWVHRENTKFNGQSAVHYMCENGVDGVLRVNSFLKAQCS